MKKLIYLFILSLSLSLWGCGGSDDDSSSDDYYEPEEEKPIVNLNVSPQSFSFDYKGGEAYFNIICNADWEISNAPSWCRFDKFSGTGNQRVKIEVDRHTEDDSHNASFTVKADTKTSNVSIAQTGLDEFFRNGHTWDVNIRTNRRLARNPYKMVLEIKSYSQDAISIDWGDGTTERLIPTSETLYAVHNYSRIDYYFITVVSAGNIRFTFDEEGVKWENVTACNSFASLGADDKFYCEITWWED